ncbi:TPA: SanA/YdcF family protein [Photobacterium damselae]
MKVSLKKYFLSIIIILIIFVLLSNLSILNASNRTFYSVDDLPEQTTCLVLGTAKYFHSGRENTFYINRMKAAVKAYKAGKCKTIIVSGDNSLLDYNEPEDMKSSLITLGIPEQRIYCDYAGGRTLDSVIRFKTIFEQKSGVVISQKFHNERAIYIAKANGIDLIGYNAKDVTAFNGFRTKIREILARTRAYIDVNILHSQPRHGGDKIKI